MMRPKIKETIKNFLSLTMNEHEAEQHMNLGYVINTIKQGQSCWQAPVSIGVHAAILHSSEETDPEEKALLQDLVGHALEPLEALLDSLKSKQGEKPLENERARMLFHTRFGLGLLLLAKDEQERAWDLLRQMAATNLSRRGADILSGPGILEATADVKKGKLLAALLVNNFFHDHQNCGERLYLVTEAYACYPGHRYLVEGATLELDMWALKAQSVDAAHKQDFPTLHWLELFAETGEILSLCQETDSSGSLPNDCKKESAQFLAYEFGQIAATFAFEDERWRENPLEKGNILCDKIETVEDSSWPRGQRKTYQALYAVEALLCDYDLGRNWRVLRDQYVRMWQTVYTYRGTTVSEIGPESDLYWAMRIGFADKLLEARTPRDLVPRETSPHPVVRDIQSIDNILSTIAIQQLKQQQDDDRRHEEILQRLPPRKQEIHQRLQRMLGEVWEGLPSRIVNALVKAEMYYRSKVNDDDAKVWFCKAVEASLRCCFVEPLTNFMQRKGHKQVAICFPAPQGVERMNATGLSRLSLPEWSDVLETLALSSHKSLASLGTGDLEEFMSAHLGGPRLPDFRPLAQLLRDVQQYRGGSAHFEEAASRSEKEEWELEQMRNLVLGINKPSVISQIFQLLAAKK